MFSTPSFVFFFNDHPTTDIYTLSLHDALPIFGFPFGSALGKNITVSESSISSLRLDQSGSQRRDRRFADRSEEHTSELQSLRHLVCRLLLEKKKKRTHSNS